MLHIEVAGRLIRNAIHGLRKANCSPLSFVSELQQYIQLKGKYNSVWRKVRSSIKIKESQRESRPSLSNVAKSIQLKALLRITEVSCTALEIIRKTMSKNKWRELKNNEFYWSSCVSNLDILMWIARKMCNDLEI